MQKKCFKITEIIPISKVPDKQEMSAAVDAAENKKNYLESGHYGEVYKFKDEFVVKKVQGHFEKEVKNLQRLYEAEKSGLNLGNSQKGLYAFKTDNNICEGYIVSTKVEGCSAYDLPNSIVKKRHFENILKLIFNLDNGITEKDNLNQNYIYIYFDLKVSNIFFTDKSAGIMDFDFLKKENIDIYLSKHSQNAYKNNYNILDDTVSLPCNLRIFEAGFIWDYFEHLMLGLPHEGKKEVPKKIRKKIFENYLKAKGEYLQKLSKAHYKTALKKGWGRELFLYMSEVELVHSRLLKSLSEDIILAEIYKIQLVYLYLQVFSIVAWLEYPIYKDFIISYKQEAENFFKNALKKAQEDNDNDKILYFNNCIKLYDKFIDISNIKYDKGTNVFKSIPTLNEMLL